MVFQLFADGFIMLLASLGYFFKMCLLILLDLASLVL